MRISAGWMLLRNYEAEEEGCGKMLLAEELLNRGLVCTYAIL